MPQFTPMENHLIEEYGNIILWEQINDSLKVYVCCKNENITIIHFHQPSNEMSIYIRKAEELKRKNMRRPKLIVSEGLREFNLPYLKKKYNSSLKLSPIVNLVRGWHIQQFNLLLQLYSQPISEIW